MSENTSISLESLEGDAIAYQVNGGTRRIVRPGHWPYESVRALSELIDTEPATPQARAELAHLENTLHADIIEHDAEENERERARLYAPAFPRVL